MSRITASIVLYNSNKESLVRLLANLLESNCVDQVFIVDNSPSALSLELFADSRVTYVKTDKNMGYGAGHNLAIKKILTTSDYHFVLNPDIYFTPGALKQMIFRISAQKEIGLLVPQVLSPKNQIQYLCKLVPSPLSLILRRFFIHFTKYQLTTNDLYELRFSGYKREMYIPIASGCFMLFRTAALARIGLFDERYFMYMEDVDICRRLSEKFKILYFPEEFIIHKHARASYKKFYMLLRHIHSACKYFNKWGWFFDRQRLNINHVSINEIRNQCLNRLYKLTNGGDARVRDTNVSIITACYNSANTILDTLNSLADQSFKKIEHIVIDGGSTDGTLDILKSWDKYPLKIVVEKDNGIYDAMNKGLKLATGDIVGILNSDDFYVNSEVLLKVVEKLNSWRVDCVYGDLIYIDKFNTNKVVRSWRSCAYSAELFKVGWQPPHPTFFVKRDVYEKYGLFDLKFEISADFELMLRFLEKHQISSAYIPEVLVKMRYGGESNKSVRNIILANVNILKAFKKNGIRVNKYTYTLYRILPKIINRIKHLVSFICMR